MAEANGAGRVAELIRTQRAVREYTDQPVAEDAIRAIVNAGRRAQSSKNGQPWYFVIVRDREQLQRLSESGQFAAHVARATFAVALVEAPSSGAGMFDLGQAAAYMQMEAWDSGVGSCVTWMHYPEKAKAALSLPEDIDCHIVLAFGYPARQSQTQPLRKGGRKTFDDVVRWERWS